MKFALTSRGLSFTLPTSTLNQILESGKTCQNRSSPDALISARLACTNPDPCFLITEDGAESIIHWDAKQAGESDLANLRHFLPFLFQSKGPELAQPASGCDVSFDNFKAGTFPSISLGPRLLEWLGDQDAATLQWNLNEKLGLALREWSIQPVQVTIVDDTIEPHLVILVEGTKETLFDSEETIPLFTKADTGVTPSVQLRFFQRLVVLALLSDMAENASLVGA